MKVMARSAKMNYHLIIFFKPLSIRRIETINFPNSTKFNKIICQKLNNIIRFAIQFINCLLNLLK